MEIFNFSSALEWTKHTHLFFHSGPDSNDPKEGLHFSASLWHLGHIHPRLKFHFFCCNLLKTKTNFHWNLGNLSMAPYFPYLGILNFISFSRCHTLQGCPALFLFAWNFISSCQRFLFFVELSFDKYPLRYKFGSGYCFVGLPALKWLEQTLVNLVTLRSFLLMSCDHLLYNLELEQQ